MSTHHTIDDIFVPSLLNEKIKLSPKYLNKDYKDKILEILKVKNEEKCSKHGYIKRNSIEIVKVSAGQLETHTLHGFVRFLVKFKALVCNPTNGSIVKSRVVNTNNFGVHCVCENITDNGDRELIIDIIVPKKSISIQSNQNINLDVLQKNDIVFVEVIGKKYEINDKRIQAVGKIVSDDNNSINGSIKIDVENNEDDSEIPQFEETYEEELDDLQDKDTMFNSGNDENNTNIRTELDDEQEDEDDDNENEDDNDNDEDEDGLQIKGGKRLNVLALNRGEPDLDNSDEEDNLDLNDEDDEDDIEDDEDDNDD